MKLEGFPIAPQTPFGRYLLIYSFIMELFHVKQ